MLKKTTLKHFDLIKALIIEGATTGVFSSELASPQADALFFNGLMASIERSSTTFNQRSSDLTAFTYFNQIHHKTNPLGFILLKGDDAMTELWMAALDTPYKNKGLGKLMFSEAIQTIRTKNIMCRCSPASNIALHILKLQGFIHLGKGPEGTDFLVGSRTALELQAKWKEILVC